MPTATTSLDAVLAKSLHRVPAERHASAADLAHALRARVPIVPVAILGSDDQAPILYDVKPLARRLGLPTVPITPTFPWFGPMGLLPYPVGYRITYGEPIPVQVERGKKPAVVWILRDKLPAGKTRR